MITITIQKDGNKYVGYKSEGHASAIYGNAGNNVLCAAISILSQSLLYHLDDQKILIESSIDKNKGILEFTNTPNEVSQICYEMTINTINILQAQYPEEINVY
jgi:uncharacterized protein YsxB (DUF464 family)